MQRNITTFVHPFRKYMRLGIDTNLLIMMKKNLLPLLFAIFTVVFTGNYSYSQSVIDTEIKSSWELLHEENGISIYGKLGECLMAKDQLPAKHAFLKITNHNSTEVTVNYTFGLQYAEGCASCDENSEYNATITIPANSSVEGDCDVMPRILNRVVSNPNLQGGWEFESIKISNITLD